MIKKLEKGLYLSIGLASLVKKELNKNMDKLVKEGELKSKDSKKIINKVVATTKKEGKKLEKFLIAELKKEAKKLKPYVKKTKSKTTKKLKKIYKKRK